MFAFKLAAPAAISSAPAAAVPFLVSLADPRGRCDRKGLLIVAGAMLAVEALAMALVMAGGLAMDSAIVLALKLACVWLATTVIIKRLHDLGKPGWRILWAFVAVMIWAFVLAAVLMSWLGDEAMATGAIGYNLTLAGIVAPVFLATMWLHFARGERGPNRYGPEPAGWGFSHPVLESFGGGMVGAAG